MAYSPPLRADQYPLVDDPDDLTTTLLALVDGVGMAQVMPSDIAGAPGPEWSPASAGTSTLTGDSLEYVAAVQGGVTKRVPSAQVLNEKYDVRRSGAAVNGTTDDAAALNDAVDVVAAAGGGQVRIPEGTIRINSVVTLSDTRVAIVGDDTAGCVINYHGSAAAFDVASSGYCRIENLRIFNAGGTGTIGVIVGPTGATTGWKFELRRIDVFGFDTYGVHLANGENCILEQVYVDGETNTGVGIKVDGSRHTSNIGMGNQFDRCRVYRCTSYGWDINQQIGDEFRQCQSLSNGGTFQVRIGGTTYDFKISGFDLEDVGGGATSSGLEISGQSHTVDVNCYSLNKGVEFAAATGCFLGPSRFSTTTTPLTIGGTCADLLIYDGGNLGTITEGIPNSTHFVGKRHRSNRLEVSGAAGAGYIEFRQEQSVAPAGAADRGRLFLRDNGSGKTQLCVIFGTGAVQVIATEP
jgi:hypothetical protein